MCVFLSYEDFHEQIEEKLCYQIGSLIAIMFLPLRLTRRLTRKGFSELNFWRLEVFATTGSKRIKTFEYLKSVSIVLNFSMPHQKTRFGYFQQLS